MGLFSKSSEKSDAVSNLRAADKALRENQRQEERAGITHETATSARLNDAANQAANEVSWWRGGKKR